MQRAKVKRFAISPIAECHDEVANASLLSLAAEITLIGKRVLRWIREPMRLF